MATDGFHLRVDEVIEAVLAAPPDDREAALTAACGNDAALRAEVESLLPHYAEMQDFMPARPEGLTCRLPDDTTFTLEMATALDGEDVDAELKPPFLIDEYTVSRVLGRGGMGVVYYGREPVEETQVAIKVLRREFMNEEELLRFRVEKEILHGCQHPGIARFIELKTIRTPAGLLPCFVMEYVDGPSLTVYARESGLDVRRRLELMVRVCEAAEYAHRHTFVHRDLKPDNILVTREGQPKVLDFGLARLVGPRWFVKHDRDGQFVGTPAYASPEQLRGVVEDLTPRSDVFSLGLVAHELLTGKLPERTPRGIKLDLRGRLPADATSVSERIDPGFRAALQVVLEKATALDAGKRYSCAGELGAAVEVLLDYDVAHSPWGQIRKSLANLLMPPSGWTPSATSRPLNAVLRARLAMHLQSQRRELVEPDGQKRGRKQRDG